MCGRYSQAYTWEQIQAFSQPLTVPANHGELQPRYNIAPTTTVDIIVRSEDGGRELRRARWGLIPGWWNKPQKEMKLATFNARVETVDTSGMFKGSFRSRRCIIPASGFFEWTGEKGGKTPHYFSAADGQLLAFAGLWDSWKDRDTGEDIVSCTIIVREADAWSAQYHDRMPCMLHPRDFDDWLDGKAGKDLLMQPPRPLREWIVSKQVNRTGVGDDDPATVAPIDADS